jgi:quinol monooxygenase YgiN
MNKILVNNLIGKKMRISKKTTFVTKPGCLSGLKELLKSINKPSKAENDCVQFDIFHDRENPIKLFIIETWENEEAMKAHENSDHYKSFNKQYLEFAEGIYVMELELLDN